MTQPFNVQANGQTIGTPEATIDSAGNLSIAGSETVGGALFLAKQSTAPVPPSGQLALYTLDGLTLSSAAPGGQVAGQSITGGLTLKDTATPATPTGGATLYANPGGGLTVLDSNGATFPVVTGGVTAGIPNGVIAQTCHSYTASATATPASGTLYIQQIFLAKGQVVSKIGFVTGLTAANGPTHWWTALLDGAYKQQAHAADQLTAAIPASTGQLLTMATPYTVPASGAYYLAFTIVTTTTQPTLVSTTTVPNAALISGTSVPTPVPGGTSTTGLTAPGTDGTTTYATPTTASNFYYLWCQ